MVGILQFSLRLRGGSPIQQGLCGNFHRPHPGQGPPGQVMAQQGGPRLIKGLFHRPLDGAVGLLGSIVQRFAGEPDHPIIPAVFPKDQSTDIGQFLPPVEGKDGGVVLLRHPLRRRTVWILRPLQREEGQHHLLHGIVIPPGVPVHIVRCQPQLQSPPPLFSNRILS